MQFISLHNWNSAGFAMSYLRMAQAVAINERLPAGVAARTAVSSLHRTIQESGSQRAWHPANSAVRPELLTQGLVFGRRLDLFSRIFARL